MIVAVLRVLAVVVFALAGSSSLAWAAFTDSTTNATSTLTAKDWFTPILRSVPDVEGSLSTGSTLTANDADFEAAPAVTSRTYTWQKCNASGAACAAIAGHTGLATPGAYPVATGDLGSTIRLQVVATRGVGGTAASETTTSTQTPPLPIVDGSSLFTPRNTAKPTISGTTTAPGVLTAGVGTWNNNPSYTYQWFRCSATGDACTSVTTDAAANVSYTLTDADRTFRIRLKVTAKGALSGVFVPAFTYDTSIVD